MRIVQARHEDALRHAQQRLPLWRRGHVQRLPAHMHRVREQPLGRSTARLKDGTSPAREATVGAVAPEEVLPG